MLSPIKVNMFDLFVPSPIEVGTFEPFDFSDQGRHNRRFVLSLTEVGT